MDRPIQVQTELRFRKIAAGPSYTCAISLAQEGYCWGAKSRYGLDSGATGNSPVPNRIPLPGLIAEIAPGNWFTCARTTDGRAYCWSNVPSSQAGTNVNGWDSVCSLGRCALVPMEVSGGHRWIAISADASHACGITTQGEVYCWGTTSEGILGTNTETGCYGSRSEKWENGPCGYVPRRVQGLPNLLRHKREF